MRTGSKVVVMFAVEATGIEDIGVARVERRISEMWVY